jgi:mRNA interferase HicA
MTGSEFLRKIARLGRARGVVVRFDRRHGKGSHGTLRYGNRKTTLKDLRKEVRACCKQCSNSLGLSRRDLDE